MRLHFSHLKWMSHSPADVLWAQRNTGVDTLSTRLGSGFHARLEGRPVAVPPCPRSKVLTKKDGSPTAFGEWLKTQPKGVLALTQKEYDESASMADAVLNDPLAGPLIARCTHIEKTIQWTILGIECKGTPDAFGPGIQVELKSDRDVRPERFQRTGKFRGYPGQVSWYENGIEISGELPDFDCDNRECYCVTVRNQGRPAVVTHELMPSVLDYGRALWTGWFEKFKVCHDSNHWPDVADYIVKWEDEKEEEVF